MYINKQIKIDRIVERVASYQIDAGCATYKTINMGGSGIVVFYRRNRNDNILQIKKVIVLYDFKAFHRV